ncbi:ABC transporter ATP-binding protein [Verminephrobacter aporrectodeae subsp. tuberculatae]|uniref:ABC transporter ATP-binding protein n=1 Tax=Verminephrobacter aporrectodeae TaxID=1110389 RepID=UPI0022441C75|nr:oligopeptide/dipeptide ABC transporter ATP-binding protein [Verminephrobacter aporrectodeae]MCW8165018.1 ABC transporter ATP-binding protein [Verminephrobacter aporrectodeae subsp. tuberculatae]MCW8168339.1 ABC transporter ATP-binding protein [Verminephrobacter aporrectodeae subsp. tuberculatae]MCW8199778.1 ABC transporter ATP-binding protein [Verminephrobacter aporrectodeae subsp. tuberculatae]
MSAQAGATRPAAAPLLELRSVSREFRLHDGRKLHAVSGVDLAIEPGQALGLVGESGCGKSTLGRLCARALDPTRGSVHFDGRDVTRLDARELRALRRSVQFIFQDPHSALNPRMSILRSVSEPLILHTDLRGARLRAQAAELMEMVGLPAQFLGRYPHELSGGQKQRVCIARAIALRPRLLVLDEPTSALDVSVQAQILAFLKDLQSRFQLSYLFISHNLAVIRALCPRVAVMYLGRIVEQGPTEEVFVNPRHPYAEALIDAIPVPEGRQPPRRIALQGDIPSSIDLPRGCAFVSRCGKASAGVCDVVQPALYASGPAHGVRCHLYAPT